MAFTKVKIISDALTLLGKGPITSLATDAPNFVAAAEQSYDLLFPSLLTKGVWRFAVKIETLSKLVATPEVDEWRFIYQIPADYIQARRVYPQSNYKIYGDKIYSNCDTLQLEYIYQVVEADLPAYFVEYFVYKLAEHLALAVAQNPQYAGLFKEKAAETFLEAQFTDSQSHPPTRPVIGRVVSVRF